MQCAVISLEAAFDAALCFRYQMQGNAGKSASIRANIEIFQSHVRYNEWNQCWSCRAVHLKRSTSGSCSDPAVVDLHMHK